MPQKKSNFVLKCRKPVSFTVKKNTTPKCISWMQLSENWACFLKLGLFAVYAKIIIRRRTVFTQHAFF